MREGRSPLTRHRHIEKHFLLPSWYRGLTVSRELRTKTIRGLKILIRVIKTQNLLVINIP